MNLVESNFLKAENVVWTLKEKPSNEELLLLYGLYKQAICGDVTESKPWSKGVKEIFKWNAWAALNGMSKAEAMKKYTTMVNKLKRG